MKSIKSDYQTALRLFRLPSVVVVVCERFIKSVLPIQSKLSEYQQNLKRKIEKLKNPGAPFQREKKIGREFWFFGARLTDILRSDHVPA